MTIKDIFRVLPSTMRTQKPHIAALSAKMEQVKRDIWHRQVWSGDGKMSKLTKYSAAVLAAGAMFAATQNAWADPNDIVGSTTGTASGTVATPEETPAAPKPIVLASWGSAAPVAIPEATPVDKGLPKAKLTDAELIKKYKLKPNAYLKLNNIERSHMMFAIMEKVESDEEAARIACILHECPESKEHAEDLPLRLKNRRAKIMPDDKFQEDVLKRDVVFNAHR